MKSNNELKIEYSIISRGTEKAGSKGYMSLTEKHNGKRFFIIQNHFEKYVKSYDYSFELNEKYSIENITVSRFEMISKMALEQGNLNKNSRILILGFGSIGFSTFLYLFDLGFKNIDILVKNKNEKYFNVLDEINTKYNLHYNLVLEISDKYNTYIDTTGSSEVLKSIFKNTSFNSLIYLIGTPREEKFLLSPLEIHRKNLKVYGGHELNGHTWKERNKAFKQLLERNKNKDLKKVVNIYKATDNILEKIYNKKENFYEVIKYDL